MQYDFEKIKNIISEAKKDDIFIMKPVASGIFHFLKFKKSLWKGNKTHKQKKKA